jgi:hypothetical protein
MARPNGWTVSAAGTMAMPFGANGNVEEGRGPDFGDILR